jgi:hypothetical protein
MVYYYEENNLFIGLIPGLDPNYIRIRLVLTRLWFVVIDVSERG